MVQVHGDEGVATHVDPEPCAGNREVVGEASAGERIGQPLSRVNLMYPRVPTRSESRKATWTSALSRALARPGVVKDPGMCGSSLHGNREVSGLTGGWTPPVRSGKVRSRRR